MPGIENNNSPAMDEERITNHEAGTKVAARENFIGSHVFGELLKSNGKNDSGDMYVAYSYNEKFPAYLWYKGGWYHNVDQYINPNGEVNEFSKQHMEDLRPTNNTHGLSGRFMIGMIHKFMKKNGIPDITHSNSAPGIKN